VAGAIATGTCASWSLVWFVVIVAVLVGQLCVLRPILNRRSDRVLAGENLPRSRVHLAYIAFEVVKAGSLIALGCSILSG
jgi:hypothetical protein